MREALLVGVIKGIALSIGFFALLYGPWLGFEIARAIEPPNREIYLDIR